MGYELYNISAKFQLHVHDGECDIKAKDKKQIWFEGKYVIIVLIAIFLQKVYTYFSVIQYL